MERLPPDTMAVIATADTVFISVNIPTKTKGLGAGQISDLKWVEASSRTVACRCAPSSPIWRRPIGC